MGDRGTFALGSVGRDLPFRCRLLGKASRFFYRLALDGPRFLVGTSHEWSYRSVYPVNYSNGVFVLHRGYGRVKGRFLYGVLSTVLDVGNGGTRDVYFF